MSILSKLQAKYSEAYWDRSTFFKICLFFTCLSAFTKELCTIIIGGFEIDIVSYGFFILLFLIIILCDIERILNFFLIVIAILASTFVSIFYLNLSILPFLKQLIPITIIGIGTSYIISNFKIEDVMHQYIKIAVIAGIIGIIQITLKLLFNIQWLTGYSDIWIDSIAREPSHYTSIIAPAVVYTFFQYKKYPFAFWLLFINLFLTFKITSYGVIAITLFFAYNKPKYYLFLIPLAFAAFSYLYQFQTYAIRIDGISKYIESGSNETIYGTVFSLTSNLEVAINNLQANPLTGTGLGGHEQTYYRFFDLEKVSASRSLTYGFGLNAKSAHSLLVRIPSETGLLGLLCFFGYLWRNVFIRRGNVYSAISIACLSHFLSKFLKLGGYFDYGTLLFFIILYYNYEEYKQNQ